MSSAVNSVSNTLGLGGYHPGDPAAGYAGDYSGEYSTAGTDVKSGFAPYLAAGNTALAGLLNKSQAGFQLSDFQADPGYQFQLQQGLRATQQQAGVTGSAFGGNTLEALDQYSQGLASTTYQNAFNRWQTQIGNLAGIAGIGANAAGAQGSNLASLFGGLTGAQSGVEGAQVSRGSTPFGFVSNLLGG